MGVWWSPELSSHGISILKMILCVSLLFGAVGFLTPVALWAGFLSHLLLSLFVLKSCYFNHSQVPITSILFIWALVDRSSGFKLDNLLWPNLFGRDKKMGRSLLVLRAYFCIIFFAAGLTKIRMGGLPWITSDSLWNMIVMQNFYFEYSPYRNLFQKANQWLISKPFLSPLIAADVVITELLAPLALIKSRASKYIILHLFLMMLGFLVFFFVLFKAWIVLFILWIDFSKIEVASRRLWNKLVP